MRATSQGADDGSLDAVPPVDDVGVGEAQHGAPACHEFPVVGDITSALGGGGVVGESVELHHEPLADEDVDRARSARPAPRLPTTRAPVREEGSRRCAGGCLRSIPPSVAGERVSARASSGAPWVRTRWGAVRSGSGAGAGADRHPDGPTIPGGVRRTRKRRARHCAARPLHCAARPLHCAALTNAGGAVSTASQYRRMRRSDPKATSSRSRRAPTWRSRTSSR